MPTPYENLLEPQNVVSGLAERIKLAPKSFFASIKKPTGPFATLGDEITIKTAHVFKPGKDWLEFQLAPQKNKMDVKTKGDLGSTGQTSEAEIFIAGSYPKAHATVRNLLNVPLVLLLPDADCSSGLTYQMGCQCTSAYIVPEFTTSTSKDGAKGYTVKIVCDDGVSIYNPNAPIPLSARFNAEGIADMPSEVTILTWPTTAAFLDGGNIVVDWSANVGIPQNLKLAIPIGQPIPTGWIEVLPNTGGIGPAELFDVLGTTTNWRVIASTEQTDFAGPVTFTH